jgi:hypothetical protein
MLSTSENNGQGVHLFSETREEGAFYVSGTTIKSRMRGFREMTAYMGWILSQGIRNNLPGSSLQHKFSNRL